MVTLTDGPPSGISTPSSTPSSRPSPPKSKSSSGALSLNTALDSSSVPQGHLRRLSNSTPVTSNPSTASSSSSHISHAHISSSRPAPPSPSPSRRASGILSGGQRRSRAGSAASGSSSRASSVLVGHGPANGNGSGSTSGAGRARPPSTLIPQPGRENETIPPRDEEEEGNEEVMKSPAIVQDESLAKTTTTQGGQAAINEDDLTKTPISRTSTTRPELSRFQVVIRDFAFLPSDDRYHGIRVVVPESAPISATSSELALGSMTDRPERRKSSFGNWGNFSLGGFGWHSLKGAVARARGEDELDMEAAFLSQSSSFETDTYPTDDDADAYPTIDDDFDDEPLGPEPEGLHRAMFPFEAMGQYEMSMEQDEVIIVSGRGGGVGWVLAKRTREVKEGELSEGLVPESYIEST